MVLVVLYWALMLAWTVVAFRKTPASGGRPDGSTILLFGVLLVNGLHNFICGR